MVTAETNFCGFFVAGRDRWGKRPVTFVHPVNPQSLRRFHLRRLEAFPSATLLLF